MYRTALLLCLFALSSASAQDAAQLAVTAPSDTFRIGERIPLTLSFTAPADAHVRIFPGPEDHRGVTSPIVEVTPASGWRDPNPQADHPMAYAGMVAGPQEISDKPLVRTLDLNEYVRFETPGVYTVVLHTAARSIFDGEKAPAFQVATSTPLKLSVIAPTPEWQAQTLANAVAALKESAASPHPLPATQSDALYRTVAALDTDAAIREMASHLDEDKPGAWSNRVRIYSAALTGLPASRKPAALAAMRTVLHTPDARISGDFLSVMIRLEPGADTPENWQRASETAWNEVAASIQGHIPLRRAELAEMLSRFYPPSPEARASLTRYIADGFHDLPPDRQAMILQYNWASLRSSAMLGEVQRLAQMPERKHGSADDPDHGFTVATTNQLRVAALHAGTSSIQPVPPPISTSASVRNTPPTPQSILPSCRPIPCRNLRASGDRAGEWRERECRPSYVASGPLWRGKRHSAGGRVC